MKMVVRKIDRRGIFSNMRRILWLEPLEEKGKQGRGCAASPAEELVIIKARGKGWA